MGDSVLPEWSQRLADRLQARSAENQPGFLLLNPCSFTRRVALELDGVSGPLPIEGPLKAAQFDGDRARLVVEIPALGFAWIPRTGKAGPAPRSRIRLADPNMVRNEFLEAEIDPATGGLRALRDLRTRVNRVGQQLVFNPGSRMVASAVNVTANGTALGEVVSEGSILDDQNEVLATFRQRFRAWLGRPVLEMRIELFPRHHPTGYPWHSYYGARFAWRDERAAVLRGVNGTPALTNHTRPVSPDYLEIRVGRSNTVIFPGGLPFHQRHGTRMLDVILAPEGEAGQAFDLALALDREHPMQTAIGMISPVGVVPTTKGPPPVGPSGWLFHVDSPNLLLTSMRPVAGDANAWRSVVAQFMECSVFAGTADFRCARDPLRAVLLDGNGEVVTQLPVNGDAVGVEFSGGDLFRVRVDFA